MNKRQQNTDYNLLSKFLLITFDLIYKPNSTNLHIISLLLDDNKQMLLCDERQSFSPPMIQNS